MRFHRLRGDDGAEARGQRLENRAHSLVLSCSDVCRGRLSRLRIRESLHLPDASGDPARRARALPEVRHGARAGMPSLEDEENPELVDFHAALLVDAAAHRRRRSCWRCSAIALVLVRDGNAELDRAGALDAGRAVGRLAVLRALGAVDRAPSPNMWTLIGTGTGAAFALQRGRDSRARHLSRARSCRMGRVARVLRGRGRHHLADAARPAPRAAGALADVGGDQGAARPRAEDRAAHQRRRHRGGHPAHARARRRLAARAARREGARWTAWCSKGTSAWTNRC